MTSLPPRVAVEWDATVYHRISHPQFAWGERVLARLPLSGHETVMDAGCGTGRLTAELLGRLPGGRVLAVDRSKNMLHIASEHLMPHFAARVQFILADLAALPFSQSVDGIFSTAVFHWITDHPRLFISLYGSLKPGGWVVAQCGGAGNLARLYRRISVLVAAAPYAQHFAGWREPKEYADDVTTAARMLTAGFVDVKTNLEPAPTVLGSAEEYAEFIASVILHVHLTRLPTNSLREQFINRLTDEARNDDPPFLLDYCRLNIEGKRPPLL